MIGSVWRAAEDAHIFERARAAGDIVIMDDAMVEAATYCLVKSEGTSE